jgi:hypothetical protein
MDACFLVVTATLFLISRLTQLPVQHGGLCKLLIPNWLKLPLLEIEDGYADCSTDCIRILKYCEAKFSEVKEPGI